MHFAATTTTPTSILQSCEPHPARYDQIQILQPPQQHQQVIYNLVSNVPNDLIKYEFCSHHNKTNE